MRLISKSQRNVSHNSSKSGFHWVWDGVKILKDKLGDLPFESISHLHCNLTVYLGALPDKETTF